MNCRWCGHDHPVTELCRARRVSRRMFLFTASAAAVGAVLPTPPGTIIETIWSVEPGGPVLFRTHDGDVYTAILKLHYIPVITSILNDRTTLIAVPEWTP